MNKLRNPERDTGKTIAVVAIAGAAAWGLYSWLKEKEILPEGDWAKANTILARRGFQVSITEPIVGDWRPANTELDKKPFSVTITSPIVGDWRPAYTELASQLFSVGVVGAPTEYVVKVASDPIWGGIVVQEPDKDKYAYGEIVKLTAKPFLGFDFYYWDFDGEFFDGVNPINFMVTRGGTVTAHFYF